MGAWLRLEIEAPYNIENLQILKKKNNGNSNTRKETTTDSYPEKILKVLKIEVPTTHITKHDFIVGQTVTVFYHSQYAIVFPKIKDIDEILKVH